MVRTRCSSCTGINDCLILLFFLRLGKKRGRTGNGYIHRDPKQVVKRTSVQGRRLHGARGARAPISLMAGHRGHREQNIKQEIAKYFLS